MGTNSSRRSLRNLNESYKPCIECLVLGKSPVELWIRNWNETHKNSSHRREMNTNPVELYIRNLNMAYMKSHSPSSEAHEFPVAFTPQFKLDLSKRAFTVCQRSPTPERFCSAISNKTGKTCLHRLSMSTNPAYLYLRKLNKTWKNALGPSES